MIPEIHVHERECLESGGLWVIAECRVGLREHVRYSVLISYNARYEVRGIRELTEEMCVRKLTELVCQ